MASPIVGAWEMVSDVDQGVVVFTDTHFSLVVMPKNRQRSTGGEPTPAEAMESYQTVRALAGTYTISGSTATLKRVANLRADTVGMDAVMEFSVQGDRMTLKAISGASRATGQEMVWRKVG